MEDERIDVVLSVRQDVVAKAQAQADLWGVPLVSYLQLVLSHEVEKVHAEHEALRAAVDDAP
ncbi:hypothetical protein [Amycolatopsis azurea]|uniref:Uncharacterized protein n=1 Tax=Amycolatopsis azurea DSM 43854 TaxID=1238180 RepID=A0ABX3JII2_9PSEU|nr:hypothetical protein [Amycolatopsis azurea]OOC07555.1 hypothetical protein B0293_07760 [Amycolatopsis azurea DSM 43854]